MEPVPDGDATPIRIPRRCSLTRRRRQRARRVDRGLPVSSSLHFGDLSFLRRTRELSNAHRSPPGSHRPSRPAPVRRVVERRSTTPRRGFYASGRAAGRRGDFITSPEVGPLFGAVVARALDAWWAELGSPRSVRRRRGGSRASARSPTIGARRGARVRRSAALRPRRAVAAAARRARRGLPLVLPVHVFGAGHDPDDEDGAPTRPVPDGPLAVSLESLPPPGARTS